MNKKIVMKGIFFLLISCISVVSAAENQFEKSIAELTNKLLPGISSDGIKPSVAIMSFSSSNKATAFDNYLVTILFENIFATGKMKLIERENIDKILNEQNFQLSGNVDDASAKSIGNIIGVDFVCYGSVNDLDKNLRISGKMVDVKTGEIVSIASVQVPKDQTIIKLLNNETNIDKNSSDKTVINKNFWKGEVNRNEFDGYTSYIFTLKSSDNYFIFIECTLYDDPSKSVLFSGFHWNSDYDSQNPKTYEIKGDDNKIVTINLNTWYTYKDATRTIKFKGTDNSRNFINILLNNNKLVIRAYQQVLTFSSHGFAEAITSAGLKYDDLDKAMKNREF